MNKPNHKKLALKSNTVRSLQAVDTGDLRRIAGGDSVNGGCDFRTHTGTGLGKPI